MSTRKTRITAKNIQFLHDDLVVRDYSVHGLGLWHFSDKPMLKGEVIINGTLIYAIKWVKEVGDSIFSYGAVWIGVEPGATEA